MIVMPYGLSLGDFPNDLDPGEYAIVGEGRAQRHVFACPGCGKLQGLPGGALVDASGCIEPSPPLGCCGFHRALRMVPKPWGAP